MSYECFYIFRPHFPVDYLNRLLHLRTGLRISLKVYLYARKHYRFYKNINFQNYQQEPVKLKIFLILDVRYSFILEFIVYTTR